MSTNPSRLAALWRFLHSWYAPAGLGSVLLIGLAFWVMPVRVERVVTNPVTGVSRTVTAWDTSRWQAASAFQGQALLLGLGLAVVVVLAWGGRGWVMAKAAAARFFALSLLAHCLLFLSLGAVPLARAVVEHAENIRIEQAAQLFHEPKPGRASERPAFEKVADLPAENAILPEVVRQAPAPADVPDGDALVPTLPQHAIRALPPQRVMFVPARPPEIVRLVPELQRRSAVNVLKPVEIDLDIPQPPPSQQAPKETPLVARPVTQARQVPVAPIVGGPESLRLPELTRPRPADLLLRGADMPSLGPVVQLLPRRSARIDGAATIEEKVAPATPLVFRQKEVRQHSVELYGGTKASEEAVERGLAWLAAHQDAGGNWSLNNFHANCKHPRCADVGTVLSDPAGTGMILLPFLGAGHTHKSGKHQATVARALAWLVAKQQPNGTWLAPADARPMYGHGMASIALCEAYGMTLDPALRGPAQKALDYIVKAQHAPSGGWRYHPNQPADTSVVGWQMMALKSGEMAKLSVPPKAFEGIKRWLASVEANRPVGGRFGYQSATPTQAMTAQGLLCLQYLGARRDDPRMRAGTDYLLANLPRAGAETSYYWYHATQVMYHMQGKPWKAWNDRLRDMLVTSQSTQGTLAGSWKPIDAREMPGGRLYATALRLLMLEVYYRHLPLYQQLK